MIENLSLHVKIKMDSIEERDIIFNALKYETSYSPNERAKAEIKKANETSIELIITAHDPVSARAALNSYMRWLNLTQELKELE